VVLSSPETGLSFIQNALWQRKGYWGNRQFPDKFTGPNVSRETFKALNAMVGYCV
jgi:hypothetical protein